MLVKCLFETGSKGLGEGCLLFYIFTIPCCTMATAPDTKYLRGWEDRGEGNVPCTFGPVEVEFLGGPCPLAWDEQPSPRPQTASQGTLTVLSPFPGRYTRAPVSFNACSSAPPLFFQRQRLSHSEDTREKIHLCQTI